MVYKALLVLLLARLKLGLIGVSPRRCRPPMRRAFVLTTRPWPSSQPSSLLPRCRAMSEVAAAQAAAAAPQEGGDTCATRCSCLQRTPLDSAKSRP